MDATGELVYRRATHDPTSQIVEEVGKAGLLSGRAHAPPEAVFEILVPDLPEGGTLRLFAETASADRGGKGRPTVGNARLVATLDLGPRKGLGSVGS